MFFIALCKFLIGIWNKLKKLKHLLPTLIVSSNNIPIDGSQYPQWALFIFFCKICLISWIWISAVSLFFRLVERKKSLASDRMFVCVLVSNKRQNDWINWTQSFCWNSQSHDARECLRMVTDEIFCPENFFHIFKFKNSQILAEKFAKFDLQRKWQL